MLPVGAEFRHCLVSSWYLLSSAMSLCVCVCVQYIGYKTGGGGGCTVQYKNNSVILFSCIKYEQLGTKHTARCVGARCVFIQHEEVNNLVGITYQ